MNLEPIRIRELEASLEAHRLLLTSVSARAEEARQQLMRIGRELCGEEFDRSLVALGNLENVYAEELATNVINTLRSRISVQNPLGNDKQIKDLQKQIDDLKVQVDSQTKRADDAERSLSDSTNQVKVLEKNLMDASKKNKELTTELKPVDLPSEPVDYSDWFEEWSLDINFERDRTALIFIGSTGISRQTEIKEKLKKASEIKEGAIYNGIDSCVDKGLLEKRTGPSAGGRPTYLVLLTEKGRWAYTHLTNSAPVPGEYEKLLKAHKSDKHTGLIFKTADYFESLGFTVQREPVTIKLAGDHIFQPDLIVQKEDETFYLEVESGEKLDRASLAQKWQNAMVVGGGRICIVAPILGTMTTLQSNVLEWARDKGKVPRLYLTHLEALRKRQKGDSPWVRIR
jgi:DNA-binding PadR family transcriptional regulator/flagellar biosynthesis chaperone FliJ